MCFSAGASFGAGAALVFIGGASLKQVQKPSQVAFASIPILFSIQQVIEGFLWVSLPDPTASATQHVATYAFLFFAQVVWPLLVPFSILFMEKGGKHKTILKLLSVVGLAVSCYLLYCLITFPVQARIIGYHVSYEQDYPALLRNTGAVLYIVATIAPLFFSQVRGMWILGLTILVSYIVTELFYSHYVVSVWCFFASLISLAVLFIMRGIRRRASLMPTVVSL
jgi:hypothetical protein